MTAHPEPSAENARTAPGAGTTYWRENLRLLGALLLVWFVVSFGFGILLRPLLYKVSILGVPAGFWFAQQGAIYVFVALIFFYGWAIGRIERRHGLEDEEAKGS